MKQSASKLIFLSSIVLMGSIIQLKAQKLQPGILIRPHLGFAKTDTNIVNPAGSSLGFDFGVQGDIMYSDYFGISTTILLSNTGFKMSSKDAQDSLTTYSYKLRYLEVPLALKFKTGEIGKFKYWAQLGLSGAINLRSTADIVKSKDGKERQVATGSDINKFNRSINVFRAGLHTGLGVEYAIGGGANLNLGLQYNSGFSDINAQANTKFFNSYVGLLVGVSF
jgi:hypothetical protein